MTIRHTLIAALATAALAAPAAQAKPADMHASMAEAAAKARALTQPDGGRTPDAPAAGPAAERIHARCEPVDLERCQSPAGQPTWPTKPTTPGATDDGSPVPVLPLVAGVLGVLLVALTAHYGVRRSSHRSRITA